MSLFPTNGTLVAALCCGLLLALSGCGDKTPQQPPAETRSVVVELSKGRFAPQTPKTIDVPAESILILRVRPHDRHYFRLFVESPSVAQTFRRRDGQELQVTLDSMQAGESARLQLAGRSVRLVARSQPAR